MTKKKLPKVRVKHVAGDLRVRGLPKGVEAEAAFLLIKTNHGWYSRTAGGKAYRPLEFLGQLTAVTHSFVADASERWG
jgi:hypothetical protein